MCWCRPEVRTPCCKSAECHRARALKTGSLVCPWCPLPEGVRVESVMNTKEMLDVILASANDEWPAEYPPKYVDCSAVVCQCKGCTECSSFSMAHNTPGGQRRMVCKRNFLNNNLCPECWALDYEHKRSVTLLADRTARAAATRRSLGIPDGDTWTQTCVCNTLVSPPLRCPVHSR